MAAAGLRATAWHRVGREASSARSVVLAAISWLGARCALHDGQLSLTTSHSRMQPAQKVFLQQGVSLGSHSTPVQIAHATSSAASGSMLAESSRCKAKPPNVFGRPGAAMRRLRSW